MKLKTNIQEEVKKYSISLSDIDAIFKDADSYTDIDDKVNYVFDNLKELPDDLICSLWDSYLGLDEDMQTSSNTGINTAIGKNKKTGYSTELVTIS